MKRIQITLHTHKHNVQMTAESYFLKKPLLMFWQIMPTHHQMFVCYQNWRAINVRFGNIWVYAIWWSCALQSVSPICAICTFHPLLFFVHTLLYKNTQRSERWSHSLHCSTALRQTWWWKVSPPYTVCTSDVSVGLFACVLQLYLLFVSSGQAILFVLIGLMVSEAYSQAPDKSEKEVASLRLELALLKNSYRQLCQKYTDVATNCSAPGTVLSSSSSRQTMIHHFSNICSAHVFWFFSVNFTLANQALFVCIIPQCSNAPSVPTSGFMSEKSASSWPLTSRTSPQVHKSVKRWGPILPFWATKKSMWVLFLRTVDAFFPCLIYLYNDNGQYLWMQCL